ncbi:MAG: peptidylprolyl isomerase [Xanthomonadales bacterium]|jgi:peptidyl-prolyl cis-trans isomerase SurA|nr:peptidylprolyl isomerase [Xanthomonadales bacterium]
MNRFFTCLVVAGLAGGLTTAFPTAATAQSVQKLDEIVALVEDDIITRSELDIAIDGIVQRIQAGGGNLPPQDLLEKQVLERLINRKLQVQRALRTGIRVSDADIDQAMMNLARQNNITVGQMRQVLEADGENFAEFRRSIGEEIMSERLRQRVVSSMDPVSDTEVEILLASEDFTGGEFDISHIQVALPDGATPPQIAEAEARIKDIHNQLVEGLDFESAAISFSESQDALEGGRIGWRDLNSLPREFSEAIRDMEPGQFTDPIRSPAGFHIVRVNDHRENQAIMAEEYRANHLLIETNELVDAEEAMNIARDLRERIVDGEDFAEIARERSDDPTSANLGGDLGWFDPRQFGDRFQAMLVALEDGEISEPFQTQAGWHVIQRVGYRETDVTDEAMANMARQTIMQRRAESEVESYIRQMREEAFVEIRLPG